MYVGHPIFSRLLTVEGKEAGQYHNLGVDQYTTSISNHQKMSFYRNLMQNDMGKQKISEIN